MNKTQLKSLIKEEIKKVLNERRSPKSSASANLNLTEAPQRLRKLPDTSYRRVIGATIRPKGWLTHMQISLAEAEKTRSLQTDQEVLPPSVEKKMIEDLKVIEKMAESISKTLLQALKTAGMVDMRFGRL